MTAAPTRASRLTKADYESFLRLRITREIVDRAGISRATSEEAESKYGIKLDCSGGILFPFFLPPFNGSTHPVAYRIRQDNPPRDASGKEERKYVCAVGSRQHPYIAPVNPEWIADPTVPVMIVEAQKSALAVLRWCEDNHRRLIPVAINGCYGWRGTVGITTTADGERVPEKDILGALASICSGRACYILLDANIATNPKVRHGRDWLANRLLAGITNDVRLLSLPPSITAPHYNGPDDFLGLFGDEKFHEIFESAEQRRAIVASETESIQTPVFADMPDTVFDGRLGEICQHDMRDFPIAYAWIALLTAAGALVPESNQSYAHTNLYGALVGPVGSGKTTAIGNVCNILDVKPPILVDVMPGSAEGLIQHIGQSGAQRLLSLDELSHLLEKAAIDRASFPYVLNRAYYHNNFSIIASGRKEIAYNAVLSVLGGIVTDNFQHSFSHTTTGGLYDRFTFGLCPTGFHYGFRPWEGTITDINPCAVTIHADVWAAKDEWKKADPSLADRVAENAIRAAIICAAWDGRKTLRADELGPARVFAEYQARVRTVLRPNPGENIDARCAFAIMGLLKNSKGALLRREVFRAVHADRFGPGAFDRAVKSLEFNGDLEQQGQRPKYLKAIREEEGGR